MGFSLREAHVQTDESPSQIWAAALGQLQMEIPRPNFQVWLRDTRAVRLDGETLVVAAPNAFAAEMLEKRLASTVERALERVSKRQLRVQVLVAGSARTEALDASYAVTAAPTRSASPAFAGGATAFRPNLTFETFVVGPSNRLAAAAALKVAEEPGRVYNPLYMYSDVGLGKTHLLHAIGHRLLARGLRVLYVSSERFTNEYVKAIRDGATEQFRERYRSADALLIDDIQFIANKEQTQEGFFHTFNELHMNGRQIVVTGDEPARKSLLQERIISRLEGGLVVDIQPPDYETRYAILQSKADRSGLRVPPQVLDGLARRPLMNVRELEGNLNRILAYAQLVGQPVTPELAQQALRSLLSQSTNRTTPPSTVITAVAEQTGVSEDMLRGVRRDKKTALARRVAMYLLREESRLPSTRVGELLGGKDHSTVLYAQKRFEEQLETDPALRQELVAIRHAIAVRTSAV
jgi:chromosomal replication initiator protein